MLPQRWTGLLLWILKTLLVGMIFGRTLTHSTCFGGPPFFILQSTDFFTLRRFCFLRRCFFFALSSPVTFFLFSVKTSFFGHFLLIFSSSSFFFQGVWTVPVIFPGQIVCPWPCSFFQSFFSSFDQGELNQQFT